jgi:hypothetical protein
MEPEGSLPCSQELLSQVNPIYTPPPYFFAVQSTKAVWKVRGLAAVRRCYAEGGGDCYTKL